MLTLYPVRRKIATSPTHRSTASGLLRNQAPSPPYLSHFEAPTVGPTFTMEVRMPFSAILGATALVDEIKLEAQLDSLLMLGHIGLLQETSERTRYFDNLYQ